MDIHSFFAVNFAPSVGMAFLIIFLCFNAQLDEKLKRVFFLLLALEALELIAYNAELVFAARPVFSNWRIFLSAVGYSLRPVLSFLVLRLTLRRSLPKTVRAVMLLPIALNILAAFSAFWTDIAYSYTAANQFVRGPLGYTSHICVFLYLAILVSVTFYRLRNRNKLESLIMFATACLVMGSMVIEAVWLIRSIGRTAIVMSTMVYYMFFQTQEYYSSLEEEERVQKSLAQQARTDQTTGLLNKAAFLASLDGVMLPPRLTAVALVFFDLDRFKNLNDTLGHQTGDQALRDVGDVIRRVFRRDDVMGRFGGDEFCVLLQGISAEQLSRKLEELLRAIRHTYTKGDSAIQVTASIGAVLVGADIPMEPSRMLETADAASYSIKNSCKDAYKIVTVCAKGDC